jgi:hypothetical protein
MYIYRYIFMEVNFIYTYIYIYIYIYYIVWRCNQHKFNSYFSEIHTYINDICIEFPSIDITSLSIDIEYIIIVCRLSIKRNRYNSNYCSELHCLAVHSTHWATVLSVSIHMLYISIIHDIMFTYVSVGSAIISYTIYFINLQYYVHVCMYTYAITLFGGAISTWSHSVISISCSNGLCAGNRRTTFFTDTRFRPTRLHVVK